MKNKNYLIALVFFFICFLINAQTKLGTVNVNAVLAKLPELADVNNKIAEYNKELETSIQEKVTSYKTKLDNYKLNSAGYSDIMKKTMADELYVLENEIKKQQQNSIKLSQIRKDSLLRPLYKEISDAIAILAKELKFTQILTLDGNEFAYVDDKFDITEILIKRFQK
jgi:outer membrane protein